MPRAKRCDEPDTWHHVMNRAVAKRPLFLSRADFRYFLSCLAREARRGVIEIHAYALMLNHFHLLVRSVRGRIDAAMQRIQTRYSRYLNRRLKRDGGLLRSRYRSRRVKSEVDHSNLVGYIDSNPIRAGSVARPELYPWGSASRYAAQRRPRWLSTSWIDGEVSARTGSDARSVEAYRRTFPARCDPDFVDWMERRLRHKAGAQDDLDMILGADPEQVRDWMQRKARLADGHAGCLPVAGAQSVLDAIDAMAAAAPHLRAAAPRRGPRPPEPEELLRAGLLRDVASLAWREIALRAGCTDSTAHDRWRAHRRRIVEDAEYAALAATLVQAAASRTVGRGDAPLAEARSGAPARAEAGTRAPESTAKSPPGRRGSDTRSAAG